MLKYFCWTTALYFVLTPLMTKIALSLPIATGPQLSGIQSSQNSNVDVPLCYIQTADGRIVNLQQLCSSQNSQDSSAVTTGPFGSVPRTQGLRLRAGGYTGDGTGEEQDSRSD